MYVVIGSVIYHFEFAPDTPFNAGENGPVVDGGTPSPQNTIELFDGGRPY